MTAADSMTPTVRECYEAWLDRLPPAEATRQREAMDRLLSTFRAACASYDALSPEGQRARDEEARAHSCCQPVGVVRIADICEEAPNGSA